MENKIWGKNIWEKRLEKNLEKKNRNPYQNPYQKNQKNNRIPYQKAQSLEGTVDFGKLSPMCGPPPSGGGRN